MSINKEKYQKIITELSGKATLVAVSKTKPAEDILELYNLGQRDFGENYVQELVGKYEQLPKDIRWHYIGHLQSNKVKYIATFVHLIHGVDSLSLLKEINKQALKNNRIIDCLLQIYIAKEETKFGLDEHELSQLHDTSTNSVKELKNVQIIGLMGMASFVSSEQTIREEFQNLSSIFKKIKNQSSSSLSLGEGLGSGFQMLSMGMSSDYKIALEEGSNMVRIGSLLFGERNYNQ